MFFPLLILSLGQDPGLVARLLGSRIIYFSGEISYSIYLVHYPSYDSSSRFLFALMNSYGFP